ncbi:hypothetical protein AURANDRAFT_12165, partial [Aureococcus anophagefferens]
DATLVRFLRARDGDVAKAEAMLLAHGAWRASSNIDALVAKPRGAEDAFLEAWWPDGVLRGGDRSGLPVQLLRLGASDIPGIEREVGRDAFVAHCAKLNEACFATLRGLSADRGTLETSCSIIMDMRGLGARHVRGVPAFGAMMKVCEPNYPERLKHVFIVRAPWIFASLYALVKPLLNETTASKVAILGDDFATTLLKYIPKETLPVDLGG